jgi:dTDP-glucose 4,6-dehydratase
MKKILVTGSCGFIFGNFVRKVIYEKRPYQLVSVDRVNFNNINSLYSNKSHTFYPADIRDQHIIDIIFQSEQPDIVVHGAASTHVDESIKDANEFVTNNVLGTQVIINSCVKYGVKKLIMISSDEVYGQLKENDSSWTEESITNPRNPYAATKHAAELLVKAASNTHGLIYNITRSSNNYGPRQTTDKFVPKVIKCIMNNEKIPIFGQGLQIRDWIHVFDNCSAIIDIIENGEPNEIYNVSVNQEYTNIEVVQKICNIMGNDSHKLISFVEERLGHDFRYSVDSSKIKNIGWKPQYKFNDGIEKCVNWFMNNRWWFNGTKN